MKFYVKADVYNELIEKAYGKRDLSKLTRKVITDKNGHRRTVFVRNEIQTAKRNSSINNKEDLRVTKYDFKTWLEDNDIVPEEYEGKSKNEIIVMARKTGLNQSDSEKAADDIKAYLSEDPRTYKETYWILDNRGNRLTNSDAKERVINNNKKIAELDKQISGMSKADAIRLNTQKHDLEYQNSYLMDRLNPKDRKEIESAKRED